MQTRISLAKTFEYSTCSTKTVIMTGDTCTEDCGICLSNLLKLETNQAILKDKSLACNRTLSGTSSWGCDGFGCLSVGSGCTCGYCYDVRSGECHDVYSVGDEVVEVNICVRYLGRSFCKWIRAYSDISDSGFGFILQEKPSVNYRKNLFVESGGLIRTGLMICEQIDT